MILVHFIRLQSIALNVLCCFISAIFRNILLKDENSKYAPLPIFSVCLIYRLRKQQFFWFMHMKTRGFVCVCACVCGGCVCREEAQTRCFWRPMQCRQQCARVHGCVHGGEVNECERQMSRAKQKICSD